MLRVKFDTSELAKVDRAFRGIDQRLRSELKDEVERTGRDVVRDARELAPVDTGRLKHTIIQESEFELAASGKIMTIVSAGGDSGRSNWVSSRTGRRDPKRVVDYADHVEYGTSRMGPQPFMVPAAEMNRNPFIHRVKALLRRVAG